MANRHRTANLALCRRLIPDAPVAVPAAHVRDWKDRYQQLTGDDLSLCPACKQGRLLRVETLLPAILHLIERNGEVNSVLTHDTS